MCSSKTPNEKLISSMQDTVRSRFKAHRRLIELDQRLTKITALSSSLVIVLTVMPYIFKSPDPISDIINFAAVSVSIVILVASLLQYSSANATTAEQHHRCALEINELVRAHSIKQNPTDDDFSTMEKAYGFLLQKYSINHEERDYRQVLLERRYEHPWVTDSIAKSYRWEKFRTDWSVKGWIAVLAMLFVVLFGFTVLGPKMLSIPPKKDNCQAVEHLPQP
ncbi:hypothetical protein EEDFHM_02203 [Methylorubrum populi]